MEMQFGDLLELATRVQEQSEDQKTGEDLAAELLFLEQLEKDIDAGIEQVEEMPEVDLS